MSIFRPLHGFTRILQCLFRMLVSGLVLFFPVVYRGSSVRVRGEFVEFGSSQVRVVWHSAFQLCYPLHNKTTAFFRVCNIEQSRRDYPLSGQMKRTIAW